VWRGEQRALPSVRGLRTGGSELSAAELRPGLDRPLQISIGRVPLRLFIPEGGLLRRARRRYGDFSSTGGVGLPIRLYRKGDAAATGAFSYNLEGASLVLRSKGAEFRGVRHEYALDSLLRILLTVVLLPRRGFLLHAATVVRDGRAYVFAGRSGAGKSTVASLSPSGSVLTDEISLLRWTAGGWRAYGTPFWGEFRAAGQNAHYPLAGIYSLVQASEERLEFLSAKAALRCLLPCVLFFAPERRAHESLLHTLVDFAADVPSHRLHFRRNAAFWKGIAA